MNFLPRTFALALAALAGLFFAVGCASTDTVSDEVDAQKRRVTTVIEDPVGAVDRIVERELNERGVDGSAP